MNLVSEEAFFGNEIRILLDGELVKGKNPKVALSIRSKFESPIQNGFLKALPTG